MSIGIVGRLDFATASLAFLLTEKHSHARFNQRIQFRNSTVPTGILKITRSHLHVGIHEGLGCGTSWRMFRTVPHFIQTLQSGPSI
jgi:hypothetical protein